jgi:hypothetical protein
MMSISPDQIALTADQKLHLAKLAEQSGKPWDAILAEALSSYERSPRQQAQRLSLDELDRLLDAEATHGPSPSGSFSRAEIYSDHD